MLIRRKAPSLSKFIAILKIYIYIVRICTGHSITGFKVIDTATHSCNTCKSLLKMGTCGNGIPPLSIERELAAANDELLKGVNRQPFAWLSREIQVYLTHSMHHKNCNSKNI